MQIARRSLINKFGVAVGVSLIRNLLFNKLLLFTFFYIGGALASTSGDVIKKIKHSITAKDLRLNLIQLGFSSSQLDSLSKTKTIDFIMPGVQILTPSNLKRAEIFRRNLSNLPGQEELIQLKFGLASGGTTYFYTYLIAIRSSKSDGNKPLFAKIFPLIYCNMSQSGGLVFSFKKSENNNTNIVVFKQDVMEDCDDITSMTKTFTTEDTLKFDSTKAMYITGNKFAIGRYDGMEFIPEERINK